MGEKKPVVGNFSEGEPAYVNGSCGKLGWRSRGSPMVFIPPYVMEVMGETWGTKEKP